MWDLRTLALFQGSEMSPGLFQDFMGFVPGVTQGQPNTIFSFLMLVKEMRTQGQSKIISCCYFCWCKSGELGDRGI